MISDSITLYLLGLATLCFSDFVGLSLFRFRKINIFSSLFSGYLMLISIYAIFKASFNSVGIFVLLWILGYVFVIKKHEGHILIQKKEYSQRLLIVFLLWTSIFILKASCFWNSEYNCPNLLFTDYEFYMKVAEGFNWSGNENAMGLRNMLFPDLSFAQPYRASDFWLVSLGLDATKIDTIYIWELFYSTILIFICSLSLFELLKQKFNFFFSLVFSVLFLFAFSGSWYRDIINYLFSYNSGSYDPIGIIAYTKLAVVFSILFQFYSKFEKNKKIEAIFLLVLIPILIQSAIAFFILIPLMILICVYRDKNIYENNLKRYLPLIILFIVFTLGVFLFYTLNQQKESFYLAYTNGNIINNSSVLELIIQFFKKSVLLFISYFWLSFLLAIILLISSTSLNKKYRFDLVWFLVLCYFSTIFVYAKYNKVGDAYQFSTNVFGPFVLSLILYLFIQTPLKTILGKIKLATLIYISFLGVKEIIGGNNVFHSTERIHYYDKNFINSVKHILPQLNYPLGIIYYGENLQNYSKEDFPLNDATFLKLFGRNYDVFNIEADSIKIDISNETIQKKQASINRNALNIWLHNRQRLSKKKGSRKDFYEAFPFSFCISKKEKDSLPEFIKSDVVSVIRDKNSKIYFYTLDRK